MNVYEYIAHRNPSGSRQVISSYDIRPSNNTNELSRQLGFCVARGGQSALDKVAKIHPDYNLIEEQVKASIVPEKNSHSNSCGCGGCSAAFNNANGQEMKADVKSRLSGEKTSLTELMVVGSLGLIGLALVLKLMK